MLATTQGRREIVEALLAHGADVDMRDEGGFTAEELASDPRIRAMLHVRSKAQTRMIGHVSPWVDMVF
jgi:ankyrin repeat protein